MDRKLLETFGKEAFTKSTVLKCRKHFKTGEWNVGISEEVIGCRNPKYQNALHQFKIEEAFYNIRACSLKAVSDGCKTDILHVTGYTITQILKMRRLSAELVRNKLTSRQLKARKSIQQREGGVRSPSSHYLISEDNNPPETRSKNRTLHLQWQRGC